MIKHNVTEIHQILRTFGLTPKEREVYLLLLNSSWVTVLTLSQKTNIKRTTLYRIIDALIKKGLVEMRVDDKTSFYSASDPKNFESLIIDQEKRVKNMRSQLDTLQSQLKIFGAENPDKTSVNFYRGIRGIQALEWKMADESNVEIYIFSMDKWRKLLGKEFAENIRDEFIKKNIIIKEILNPQNDSPLPNTGVVNWTKHAEYILHNYQHRTIDPKILPIGNEFYIFENKIVLFSLEKDDVVGIEIMNKNYAQLLRQLFKLAWNQAKVIDDFGGENF